MKALCGFAVATLLCAGLFAQGRSSNVVRGNFGNVVFPGGTSATVPGTTRNFGNVVFPGGGGPGIRQNIGVHNFGRNFGNNVGNVGVGYAYPVYVGGYGYDSYVGQGEAMQAAAPQPQQPNVVVVYAPPPQMANPVVINVNPKTGESQIEPPPQQSYMAPPPPQAEPQAQEEPTHYLIAMKDHTIYAALAYWVEGDTVHYFTSGNVHNQVSLSLIDRELTSRLGKESGVEVKLPPAK